MNEQYIHKLTYTTKVTDDVYDQETGQWIVGAPGADVTVICRAKPNGSGRRKPNKDGVLTEYSFDLGFPITTRDIPQHAHVKITGVRDELLFEGELMGYQVGEYSILGWI
jgi:hypothetical protein